jgi:hypothetical protein
MVNVVHHGATEMPQNEPERCQQNRLHCRIHGEMMPQTGSSEALKAIYTTYFGTPADSLMK